VARSLVMHALPAEGRLVRAEQRVTGLRRTCCQTAEGLMVAPVVLLELPVVILFALYPGLFSLSQLAR
jgi:hypothetical protein